MKKFIARNFPPGLIIKVQNIVFYNKRKRLQTILNNPRSEKQLSIDDLSRIISKNKPPVKTYHYDIDSLKKRGIERAYELSKIFKKHHSMDRTLEVGSKDGMISYYLSKKYNKKVTCFDLNPKPSEFLTKQNITYLKGNVEEIPVESNSFDMVFSYNSFEHFLNPEKSLKEMIRVIRPNGLLYLNFGPIYNAPKGFHTFNKIPIAYCQHLFQYKTLEEYTLKNNLGKPKFNVNRGLNGYSLKQYRKLWKEVSDVAKVMFNYEHPTYKYVDVIEKYPHCFGGKFESIDELLVTQIQILFKKK